VDWLESSISLRLLVPKLLASISAARPGIVTHIGV
jgi:hypothetical protein